jgi:outer membrane protein assembly factor BamB
MTIAQTDASTPRKPLRLWPGVVLVILQWLAWFVVPFFLPETHLYGLLVGVVCGLAIVVWWMFFSRAPWAERVGAFVLMIIAPIATKFIVHKSIAGGGMGMLLFILVVPMLSLALVLWAVASRRLSAGPRRAALVVAVLLACGMFTLIRTGGITADFQSDFHWRWTKTPEELLLAQAGDESLASTSVSSAPALPVTSPGAETGADWPGFRGPKRDGVVRGVRIKTDWAASPPVEIWRRPIGPAWSSFAVHSGRLYTQEQRGDDEIVSCYDVNTGKPVWRHRDAARFWESNAGPGPRATPTLSNGRVYTLGATGIVNVLDEGTGNVVWSRNAVSDTGAKIPGWGISGSPLVVNDVVIVAASGDLVAYDLANGNPRWFGPKGGSSYSSPQLLTVDGVAQVLLLSAKGASSVALADGKLLWEHAWPGIPIVQPNVTENGDILISVSDSSGTRRLGIEHGAGGWNVQERWTSEDLNPFFNDLVVHNGHAFGFDGNILACIDLADGKLKWKGGKYGHGQLVLLPEQNVLMILSEAGDLALVNATSDQFTELAHFPAIKGKTWNHPVLAGDVLLVRNGEEMAAFRLSLAGS